MTALSYSPLYYQPVIWVVEYDDGTLIREWDDSGKEHLFCEINKSKLRKFHLVSEKFDYFYDCKTGVFTVDGKSYVFPLAGESLNYGEGLIHYKEVCEEIKMGKRDPYEGFTINSFFMGWKVTKGDAKSQVIFNATERIFNVELTFLDLQKTVRWNLKV